MAGGSPIDQEGTYGIGTWGTLVATGVDARAGSGYENVVAPVVLEADVEAANIRRIDELVISSSTDHPRKNADPARSPNECPVVSAL